MNIHQLNKILAEANVDTAKWGRCHECCPSMKKIKCYYSAYEMHLYYGRKIFNVFHKGRLIITGNTVQLAEKTKDL